MRGIDIFYAVKANPHPDILSLFVAEGAYFDCASFKEITLVLAAGCRPSDICFGSTLKKPKTLQTPKLASAISLLMPGRITEDADHAPGSMFAAVYYK